MDSTQSAASDATPPASSRSSQPAYRPDVDGLRAVAILLTVGFHADLPGMGSGFLGVDVFFVISGYLIVGGLARELLDQGRIRWTSFIARRIRRLLPSAIAMLLVVHLLSIVLLDRLGQLQAQAEATAASALSVANIYFWQVADVGYFAPDASPPVVLHMWSLSVEEQFYLATALAFVLVARTRSGGFLRSRRGLAALVLVTTIVSLAIAAYCAVNLAATGFYSPVTRAFEFGFGALVALTHRRPAALRFLAPVALGLIVILSCVDIHDPALAFLRLVAVTAATAVVIAAGPRGLLTGSVLSSPPLVRLGIWSYGWYLWHYPLLILAIDWNLGQVPLPARVAILIGSLGIAAANHRILEEPVRRARAVPDVRALRVGVAAMVVTAAVAGVGHLIAQAGRDDAPWTAIQQARNDRVAVPESCGGSFDTPLGRQDEACEIVPATGDTVIVLWGDSHAWQYLPALEAVARERGDGLTTWLKTGCAPFDPDQVSGGGESCRRQNRAALAGLRSMQRASHVVLILAARWETYLGERPVSLSDRVGKVARVLDSQRIDDVITRGVSGIIAASADNPTSVVLMRSSLELPREAPACELAPLRPFDCGVSEKDARAYTAQSTEQLNWLAETTESVVVVADPLAWSCSGNCPARANGTFVLFDDDHLSATFARSLVGDWRSLLASLRGQRLR